MRRGLLLLVVLAAAALGPSGAEGGPEGGSRSLAALDEARALLREHRAGDALARLRREGGMNASAPERTWLLAQVAPAFQGLSATRAEVAQLPASGLRRALEAVLASDPRRERDALRVAMHRGGDAWMHLALAQVLARLGEDEQAATSARRASFTRNAFLRVEALLAEGRALVEAGELSEAGARAAEAAALAPRDGRGPVLAGEVARRRGRFADARAWLREALRRHPRHEPTARRLAELLREEDDGGDPQRWLGLEPLLDARNPEAWAIRGLAAEARGEDAVALAAFDRALETGANRVPLERRRRHVLARLGRYGDLVRALEAALPAEERLRADNLVGPRWRALGAAGAAAPHANAAPEALATLGEALVGVGALTEARVVLAAAGTPDALERARRVAGQLAFERALRCGVEEGYRAGCVDQPVCSVDTMLANVAALAARHLAPEEGARLRVPATGLRRVALLGAWLDHRAASEAPLVQHFRRYGRYLVLGQREGEPCEAIVLALGVLVPAAPLVTRGQAHRHDFALGYDRVVRSYIDAQGGGLAGACLPDGLWLDADAALESESDVHAVLRRDPSLVEAALRQPLPRADGPEGPFDVFDTGGVLLRLWARYAQRRPGGRWGSLGTLHAHENGHVIDIRRHLPLWEGLPATLGLLAEEGFAFQRFEAALERRAQLASVIDAPDPDLALAEMVELLPAEEHEPEAHAAGYRQALERLVRHVWSRPDLYPEIDRTALVLPQLDRLSLEQLRRAARAVVD